METAKIRWGQATGGDVFFGNNGSLEQERKHHVENRFIIDVCLKTSLKCH